MSDTAGTIGSVGKQNESAGSIEMLGDFVFIRDSNGMVVAWLNALAVDGIVRGDDGTCQVVIDSQLIELPVHAVVVAGAIDKARRKR